MSILQNYERTLSQYKELMKTVSKIEEESVILAYELQKDLQRASEIFAHEEDLKSLYEDTKQKEEITNVQSRCDLSSVQVNRCDSLKEILNSASTLIQGTKNEIQFLVEDTRM